MKYCLKCKTEKPVSEFPEIKLKYTKKSGEVKYYIYQESKCKECKRSYHKKWSKENKSKRLADRLTAY
jgi:hypothetical protein